VLAPSAVTRPALSAPAVAMTVARRCAASWTSMPPVTPPAPFTSTVCPAPDPERVADRLIGGECRDRQRRGGIERHRRGQDGHVAGGGDVLPGPGALPAQRSRVRGHPVARRYPGNPAADRGDVPGRLDA
jgi:hypothetical protein